MTPSHSARPPAPLPESSQATDSPPMTHSPTAHDTPSASRSDRTLVTDEDTFSRTILTLAEADLAWMGDGPLTDELSAIETATLSSVMGAIDPLLDMVTHLRSPAGDWPPDLPWTPANIYPYVADEVYDVLNAYQTALTPAPASPPAAIALAPPRDWTLQDLAPRLLWAIAHGGAALMTLLSGVTAAIQTPQGEWQGGLLRLVVILTATPMTAEAEAWAVDLAVQRPPLPGVTPDRPLQIHAPLPDWTDGTAAQLLTQVYTLMEQDQPSLLPWLRGTPGDWLMPGSPWQSGTLALHCDLEFIPLPTLVMAATGGNVALGLPTVDAPSIDSPQPMAADLPQPSAQPVAGISVPLSLFDWEREADLEDGDTDGETTIFFLDDDDQDGDQDDDQENGDRHHEDRAASGLGTVGRPDIPTNSVATVLEGAIADRAADAVNDLMPPFPPTPLTDDANAPEFMPLTASYLFDDEADADQPSLPAERSEPSLVAMPDLGTLESAPDLTGETGDLTSPLTEDTLLTAAAIFPDLSTVGTVSMESGPIARVRGQSSPTATDRLPLWREILLRQHLLTQFPTWQRLAQRPDRDAIDPDPLMLAMIETACTLIPQLEQPECWLLPPTLAAFNTEGGCPLSELLLGLFWSVTRSAYAIAQLVGGVYAQVLQPHQGWQTGTLRLMWMLTITTDERAWCWDLTTRQLLTTVPPVLDPQAVLCLDHLPAYPMPLRVTTLEEQIRHQLRMNAPRLLAWERGLPLAWQAPEATAWQVGEWHLTSNLEFVATD